MQTITHTESMPSLPIFASDAEFEFMEPKRIVLSPAEVCFLANPDDLFDDED